MFFHLAPGKAVLGDTNSDLIITYAALRDDPCAVEEVLSEHGLNHCDDYYYAQRDALPRSDISRAARFIYLNRTCFNGIFRVNLAGLFNVPKGTKDSVIFDDDDFAGISKLLKNAEIRVSDFQSLIDDAIADDFIFADPPYTVRHNSNAFIKYNENLFSWHDQERLADALKRARERGAHIIATNANHDAVKAMYRDRGFSLHSVSRFSSISANSQSRNQFEELVALSTADCPNDEVEA